MSLQIFSKDFHQFNTNTSKWQELQVISSKTGHRDWDFPLLSHKILWPSAASLRAVGRAGGLQSWGTFIPFSEWCREGTKHHHSRSRAQSHSCCPPLPALSIFENVFLQESDPHIFTQFQNDSEDWWLICVCSHYLLISISLQSALYYLRTVHWVGGFSGSFDLPLSSSVTSIFRALCLPTCQCREQSSAEKELSLLLILNLSVDFLCFIPCLFSSV